MKYHKFVYCLFHLHCAKGEDRNAGQNHLAWLIKIITIGVVVGLCLNGSGRISCIT